jgi:hypothetical protein
MYFHIPYPVHTFFIAGSRGTSFHSGVPCCRRTFSYLGTLLTFDGSLSIGREVDGAGLNVEDHRCGSLERGQVHHFGSFGRCRYFASQDERHHFPPRDRVHLIKSPSMAGA